MPLEAFSEEWSHACCERLNARERFRSVGSGWVSPVILVMRADPARGIPEARAVFLDLYLGECRQARVATPMDFESAEFVLAAQPTTWRRMLQGEQDPITAVMFGKLRLEKGSLPALMPYAAAAREMVAAASEVGAELPGAAAEEA